MADDQSFLRRWSRRKHEATRAPEALPQPATAVMAPVAAAAPAPGAAVPGEPPPLPPVESLTMTSDFTPFLSAKVEEAVKRAALRKLFSDPHFNVMDGLDVYIDDYSKPDPLPEGFLDKLADVYKTIDEKLAEAVPPETAVAAAETPPVPDAPAAGPVQEADDRQG